MTAFWPFYIKPFLAICVDVDVCATHGNILCIAPWPLSGREGFWGRDKVSGDFAAGKPNRGGRGGTTQPESVGLPEV